MKGGGTEKSPILGSWTAVYLLVAGTLVALGVAFYFFTKYFE